MSNTRRFIGMGLGLAILISSMGFAFAADSGTTAGKTNTKYQNSQILKMRGGRQKANVLDALVKAGTLTSEQQNAIEKEMKSSREARKTIKESLDSLVSAGTITQSQEDAVIKASEDAKAKMTADMEKKLEELAAKKGITVDELKAQMKEQKAGMVKGDIKGKMQKHDFVLDNLVKAGTLTAEQQKAIEQAMKPSRDAKKTIKESLDSLVSAGTITKVQEDAVIKAFDDAKAQLTSGMEKKLEDMAAKKGITVDELKAQMKDGARIKFKDKSVSEKH
jgi:competence protein ComGC